jgi:heat shock protein HtpX
MRFATGAFKNSSLVAVSSRSLGIDDERRSRSRIGARSFTHIVNGDMVTLQFKGVMSRIPLVVFFAKIVGYFVDRVVLKMTTGPGMSYYVTISFAKLCSEFYWPTLIVAWFSRPT